MKAHQVRATFLEYFAAHGHEEVHSSSLVPANDPSLLFTNAGMVQFKDVFTGQEHRAIRRATSSQKCVRAGGKHNDLDEVGKTARHHTFFEMLGNFSFGDYFKEDAIAFAWELLTAKYEIDPNRLIITVFGGDDELGVPADDEARAIWRRVTGFGDDRILGLGKAENFWMMGEVGPMGPCSEIHYAQRDELLTRLPTSGAPEAAWDGWVEIWNLVFMQYERKIKAGPLDPLPAPSIDTGAGLERVAAVLQGVDSNYDTDLFTPLTALAAELAGKKLGADASDDISMRVIADHARTVAFLIADGVFPDKTKREYTLRRIFRRAVRHGKLLGIDEPFMHEMCARVVAEMGEVFPELSERASVINEVTLEEEKRFRATLDRGLGLLAEEFAELRRSGTKTLPGGKVFQLYDTFGFPEDLTEIIATEEGFTIDHAGFDEAMAEARKKSSFVGADSAIADIYKELADRHGASEFVGYESTRATGELLALIVDGEVVDHAEVGAEVALVCNRTPFYGESGGQSGDSGEATTAAGARVRIDNTLKPAGDVHVHRGEVVAGKIVPGDTLLLEVDDQRRNHIRANHSATHLLQLALRAVLGDHVAQKGSLVASDRLRFDFSHFNAVTDRDKRAVEDLVNAEIRANLASEIEVLPIAVARERGAVAMFGEKYGETVRVVHIGGQSLEFCGGTHVARTGDIGLFKILSEASVAQGVRRIEAVTGVGALLYVRKLEDELSRAAGQLKVAQFEIADRVAKLHQDSRVLEREVATLKTKLASGGARDLLAEAKEIAGIKLIAVASEVGDAKSLRETGDNLRERIGSGVIVLAGVADDKVSLVAMVTSDLTKRVHAGKLLKAVAEVVDGRGGGRPDMAQGGGRDVSKVGDALARAEAFLRECGE